MVGGTGWRGREKWQYTHLFLVGGKSMLMFCQNAFISNEYSCFVRCCNSLLSKPIPGKAMPHCHAFCSREMPQCLKRFSTAAYISRILNKGTFSLKCCKAPVGLERRTLAARTRCLILCVLVHLWSLEARSGQGRRWLYLCWCFCITEVDSQRAALP